MSSSTSQRGWVVLLSRSSYLAGTILLHYSLQRVHSKHALHVLVPPSLPEDALTALHSAACSVIKVEEIQPPMKVSVVAERFADTWTKLAAFGLEGFEKVVMLDADMLVFQNMDELFDVELPKDGIGANHACVCNWGRDPWSPEDWRPWNCAWTDATHTGKPTLVTDDSRHTHTLLNSGLVILHPSPQLLSEMKNYLSTSPLVPKFSFPDQDFLTEYYRNRWVNIGWEYNAIKTARYWHPKLWRDSQVKNLHYIVKKPWSTPRQGWKDHTGDDTVTHEMWWSMWYEYKQSAAPEVIKTCEQNMLGEGVEVGPVQSWEQAVQAEKEGVDRGYSWPPGDKWNQNVDGHEY